MNQLQIEKGIPMPAKRNKYPFKQMAVGDSFFFIGSRSQVTSAAYIYQKKNGVKFSIRKVDKGHRVWRII